MPIEKVNFPAMCLYGDDDFRIKRDFDDFTCTTSTGLKNGMFDDVLIIGSNGWCLRVKGAVKLHGIGFLFGYNPFFMDQKIRIQPRIAGEPFQLPFWEARRLILRCLIKSSVLRSMVGASSWRRRVWDATTISELIYLIEDPVRAIKPDFRGS